MKSSTFIMALLCLFVFVSCKEEIEQGGKSVNKPEPLMEEPTDWLIVNAVFKTSKADVASTPFFILNDLMEYSIDDFQDRFLSENISVNWINAFESKRQEYISLLNATLEFVKTQTEETNEFRVYSLIASENDKNIVVGCAFLNKADEPQFVAFAKPLIGRQIIGPVECIGSCYSSIAGDIVTAACETKALGESIFCGCSIDIGLPLPDPSCRWSEYTPL